MAQMGSPLVPAREEVTEDQSRCLFKAAGLSAEDFHSSSTPKTAASVIHKGMEKQYLELHLADREGYYHYLLLNEQQRFSVSIH